MSFDNTQAKREGWMVNALTSAIESFDSHRWRPDSIKHEKARDFVKLKAAEGSPYHIEALAYVAFTEPVSPSNWQGDMRWINIPSNFPKHFTIS